MDSVGRVDLNFITSNVSDGDKDLFFGPLEGEKFEVIEDHEILAHLIAKTGVFQSVGQARKNGWNKEIPLGFSEFVVGRNKARVTILYLR